MRAQSRAGGRGYIVSRRFSRINPRLDCVVYLDESIRLAISKGGAAGQVGRKCDEPLVFVAPKHLFWIFSRYRHRSSSHLSIISISWRA